MERGDNESYLHFYAKKVLMEWLVASKGKFFSLRWNPSLTRIYEEYPLVLGEGNRPEHGLQGTPWDELPQWQCSCPLLSTSPLTRDLLPEYGTCSHLSSSSTRKDYLPSREELLQRGVRVGAIIDVAVVDEGRVKYLFEIVHTHGLTPIKKNFLYKYCSQHNALLYEVDAHYILRQVTKPSVWRGIKVVDLEQEVKHWRPSRRARKNKYRKH
jgi:hypothetical protein